jgi:hypothetical protein
MKWHYRQYTLPVRNFELQPRYSANETHSGLTADLEFPGFSSIPLNATYKS